MLRIWRAGQGRGIALPDSPFLGPPAGPPLYSRPMGDERRQETPWDEPERMVAERGVGFAIDYALRVATVSAASAEGSGLGWVSSVRHIVEALSAAVYGIRFAGLQPLNGPKPSEPASQVFLLEALELSLRFLRTERYASAVKHIDRKEFRKELLRYMKHPPEPMTITGMVLIDYTVIAGLLHRGSSCFPVLGTKAPGVLAAELHEKLGPYFFQNTTDPNDRASEILRVAGVDRRERWNLLKGAARQRQVRAKRATKK